MGNRIRQIKPANLNKSTINRKSFLPLSNDQESHHQGKFLIKLHILRFRYLDASKVWLDLEYKHN